MSKTARSSRRLSAVNANEDRPRGEEDIEKREASKERAAKKRPKATSKRKASEDKDLQLSSVVVQIELERRDDNGLVVSRPASQRLQIFAGKLPKAVYDFFLNEASIED